MDRFSRGEIQFEIPLENNHVGGIGIFSETDKLHPVTGLIRCQSVVQKG
jgi:hypothetical protein